MGAELSKVLLTVYLKMCAGDGMVCEGDGMVLEGDELV